MFPGRELKKHTHTHTRQLKINQWKQRLVCSCYEATRGCKRGGQICGGAITNKHTDVMCSTHTCLIGRFCQQTTKQSLERVRNWRGTEGEAQGADGRGPNVRKLCMCRYLYMYSYTVYIYIERVFSVSKIKEQSLSLKAWFVPRHGLVFYRVVRFVWNRNIQFNLI